MSYTATVNTTQLITEMKVHTFEIRQQCSMPCALGILQFPVPGMSKTQLVYMKTSE